MSKKTQSHDLFFKSFMQDKQLAEDFLRTYLPIEIVGLIDFSTLMPASNELLPPTLKKLRCDVVLHCKINQGKDHLYLIIEHQSTSHWLMALRVHEYVSALMRGHLKQKHKKLPLVLPLVIYHGNKSPYPYTNNLLDCVSNPQLAHKFMLKPFQLIDLSVMSNEVMETHGFVAVMEWFLRDSRLKGDEFLEKAKQHLRHPLYIKMMKNFNDFRVAVFEYIIDVYKGEKSPDEVIDELSQVAPEEKQTMLTAGQQLEQRGIQQGMQQGIQQGEHNKAFAIAKSLLEAGVDQQIVRSSTGLSDQEIATLRRH